MGADAFWSCHTTLSICTLLSFVDAKPLSEEASRARSFSFNRWMDSGAGVNGMVDDAVDRGG